MLKEFKYKFDLIQIEDRTVENRLLNCNTSLRELQSLFQDFNIDLDEISDEQNHKIAEISSFCIQSCVWNTEITEKIIEMCRMAGVLRERAYHQYIILKNFLLENNLLDIYPNIMLTIAEIFNCEILCIPSENYLLNNFGVISVEVLNELKVSRDNLSKLFDTRIFLIDCISSTAVLHTPDYPCAYIEDEYMIDDNASWCGPAEEETYAEYYESQHQMTCRERLVTDEVFNKLQNIKIMPMYTSMDCDMCECLAGSFVNLKNESTGESVTFRIVYTDDFKELEEFDECYSNAEKGYESFTATELCDILTHGDTLGCDIPIALHLCKWENIITK